MIEIKAESFSSFPRGTWRYFIRDDNSRLYGCGIVESGCTGIESFHLGPYNKVSEKPRHYLLVHQVMHVWIKK